MSKSRQTNQSHESDQQGPNKKSLTYILTVGLLVVLIVAFIGAPAISGTATRDRLIFGKYAGKEISYEQGNYLARRFADLAAYVEDNPSLASTPGIERQVWRTAFDQTVFHYAMTYLASEAGLSISEVALSRALSQWPDFQVDGRYSAEAYNRLSEQSKFSLRQYLRESLIDEQVRADLLGRVLMSEAEQQFLVNMAADERQFRYVQFGFEQYPESEVAAYGEENASRFRKARISRITVGSEEDAIAIRERALGRGETFEDLARTESTDMLAEDGGDMGWVYVHELEPDFEDVSVIDQIFSLDEGEISQVLQTTFGWAIYQMDEGPIDPDFTDTETLADVRDYLSVFERGLVEDYLNAQATTFAELAAQTSFSEAADDIDQQPQLTGYFPINYGNVSLFDQVSATANASFASGAYREDFFEQLFELEAGEVSEPIIIRDFVFVLQLADQRSASQDTLDSVESSIPSWAQQLESDQLESVAVRDDLLVDNFSATYDRAVRQQ